MLSRGNLILINSFTRTRQSNCLSGYPSYQQCFSTTPQKSHVIQVELDKHLENKLSANEIKVNNYIFPSYRSLVSFVLLYCRLVIIMELLIGHQIQFHSEYSQQCVKLLVTFL